MNRFNTPPTLHPHLLYSEYPPPPGQEVILLSLHLNDLFILRSPSCS